jgi:hypothetical protein
LADKEMSGRSWSYTRCPECEAFYGWLYWERERFDERISKARAVFDADVERRRVGHSYPGAGSRRKRDYSNAPEFCVICGKFLLKRRADALTCSDRCRQRKRRATR